VSAGPRPIVIVAYRPQWPEEFRRLAGRVRSVVGGAAVRIDHIGSTAVPGLGAKDVIDVQITVSDLDRCAALTGPLAAAGFRHGGSVEHDVFRPMAETDPELRKRFLREPAGERRVHLHVRELGRFNQRYALLVRDYLRASGAARAGYERAKREAARIFPDDVDGYLALKDPVFHLLYEAASLWADKTGWRPDPGDA
jgi:GrpB-like predicted nucleotidyltransferase (UPF0157 family)